MKFLRENKVIVLVLLVVLVSLGLLALPGQFAHYSISQISGKHVTYNYYMSGYQWIFNLEVKADTKIGTKVVAQGIAILSMLALCIPGLLFSKKSSFVSMLTSLALIVVSILCFTISAAGEKCYPFEKLDVGSRISWVPYVIGGLVFIVGALMCYKTFKVMKDEVKSPAKAKGPTYSYLHK